MMYGVEGNLEPVYSTLNWMFLDPGIPSLKKKMNDPKESNSIQQDEKS